MLLVDELMDDIKDRVVGGTRDIDGGTREEDGGLLGGLDELVNTDWVSGEDEGIVVSSIVYDEDDREEFGKLSTSIWAVDADEEDEDEDEVARVVRDKLLALVELTLDAREAVADNDPFFGAGGILLLLFLELII